MQEYRPAVSVGLEGKLVLLCGQLQLLKIGYLVRLSYGDTKPAGLALLLRGQSGQNWLFAERVGKIFATIFGSHQHLDVIWLTPDQETSLAKSLCSVLCNEVNQ